MKNYNGFNIKTEGTGTPKEKEAVARQSAASLWRQILSLESFYESTNKMTLLLCGNQVGKGNSLSQPIPTPIGWVKAGDIKSGDIIFDERGVTTNVLNVFPNSKMDMYRYTFDDGSSITVDSEHRWKCQTYKNRFKRYRRDGSQYDGYGEWQVLSTEDLIKIGGYSPEAKNAKSKIAIPVCSPVDYPEKKLDIDPYVLGAMLGDGCFIRKELCCGDIEVIDITKMPTILLLVSYGIL